MVSRSFKEDKEGRLWLSHGDVAIASTPDSRNTNLEKLAEVFDPTV
jgi:hypothetical protein